MRCISAAYALMRCLSVCLSVCVSVTFVSCVKTNKVDIFEICSPSGSQAITEFYALVGSKSEAAVTGNKKPRCRYVEADYRQTRSIARSLCDS